MNFLNVPYRLHQTIRLVSRNLIIQILTIHILTKFDFEMVFTNLKTRNIKSLVIIVLQTQSECELITKHNVLFNDK